MTIKLRFSSIIIAVILFLADHCLWIVDSNAQSRTNQLCWLIIVALFCLLLIKKGPSYIVNKKRFNFAYIILFVFAIYLYSVLQSYFLHDQSLMQGFIPQMPVFFSFLLYFILTDKINRFGGKLQEIKRIVLIIGCLELFLYILQYFLFDYVHFLNMNYSFRLNDVRLNLDAICVPFVVFESINNIFYKKKNIYVNLILIIAGLFYSIGIGKTRIALIAYLVSIVCGFVLWKHGGRRKVVAFFIIGFVFLALLQSDLFSFFIEGIQGGDLSSQTRELGRQYYLSKIVEHPLFGAGYLNTANYESLIYSGMNSISTGKILWVDLGIYGLVFVYGFVGLLWLVALLWKMIKMSWALSKKKYITYIMYMIYILVLLPNNTGFMWHLSNTVNLVVWISLMEGDYKSQILDNSIKSNNTYDKEKA